MWEEVFGMFVLVLVEDVSLSRTKSRFVGFPFALEGFVKRQVSEEIVSLEKRVR